MSYQKPTFPAPDPAPLKIHYQDSQLIVIEKPAWLLSVPGKDPEHTDSVVKRMEDATGKPVFVVHRLDCATSGLMILALTKSAQSHLNQQFRERIVKKEYQAWIQGVPTTSTGTITEPLMRKSSQPPIHMVDHQHGKPSTTHWKIIKTEKSEEQQESRSLLLLTPITGRSHQLRVHLAWLGYPIIGDRLYSKDRESARKLPRMYLHASALSFTHPETGEVLIVHSIYSLSDG